MKKLIYVPIIHTSADLGSLGEDVNKRGIANLGGDVWEKHLNTVLGFWEVITDYFKSINVSGIKIYQDGMIADGEIGIKIIEEGVKSGSKNYSLLKDIVNRGAILVKTEDYNMILKERDSLVAITQEKSKLKKIIAFLKYKFVKNKLLTKRDKFIAQVITKTLNENETGIAFIGAHHRIKEWLPEDIKIVEVKDINKISTYHTLIPFYDKNAEEIEKLREYMISKIEIK